MGGKGKDEQYQAVAALAKKLHEEEKVRYEERKRRRAEKEKWERVLKRKLEEEEEKLKAQEIIANKSNTTLYKLFNDLQGVSHEFGFSISKI